MAGTGSRLGMKLLSTAIGIPVGIAMKRIVERTWTAARPDDPPRKAKDSRAGVAAAQLVTRRAAEASFRGITGTEPPPPKPTKAEKKALKKEQAAR
jgi:hypothetical protein